MDDKTHVSQKVLRFLLKRSHNPEIAQEVLQETWVAALKSYHIFKHKSSYFTWVCKIALNKLSDYYRDQVRHQSHFVVPAIEKFNSIFDPSLSPDEKLALGELKLKVNKCLNLLPMEYRQLLQLRYYEQLTCREISIRLKIPERSLEGKTLSGQKISG